MPILSREVLALRTATLEARQRMGDPDIVVAVKNGEYIVQTARPRKNGTFKILNLSDPGTILDAIGFLNNL
jgi:hypothetical protein